MTKPNPVTSPVLTLDEVATILHVHKSTVYRLIGRDIDAIPGHFKIGSDHRWNAEQFEAWRLGLGR